MTVIAFSVVAAETWLSSVPIPILSATIAVLAIIGIFIRRHLGNALLVALFLSLSFTHLLSRPALSTPVNVYWIDLLIGPLLVAGALELIDGARLPRLGRHFLLIVAFASIWTVLGVSRGQDPRDAIGVFRRVALYPMIYLVAALAFERRMVPIDGLRKVVLASAAIITLQTLYRLIVGEGYAHLYFEAAKTPVAGGVSRWTSYVEVLAPVLAMGMVAGNLGTDESRSRRFLKGAGSALFLFPVVASNYRSVWGAFLIGALIWVLLFGESMFAVVKRIALVSVLALVVGVGVWAVADESGLPTQKFSMENLRRTTGWRTASWKKAARVFASSPLTGVGFGYRHVFQYRRSEGGPVATAKNTVHNDLLWLLVDAGLIGALLILGFHVRWWLYVSRKALALGKSEPNRRALLSSILSAYLTIGVVSCFQPVFSIPALVLSVSMLMAFASALATDPEPAS